MIEAQVRPSDVDGVISGLSAVRFPAFDDTDIPRLDGTVTTVSADRLIGSGGTAYFLVRIQVDEAELAALGGRTLIPGMPAEVLINKSERTLLSYLLAPAIHGIWTAFRQ